MHILVAVGLEIDGYPLALQFIGKTPVSPCLSTLREAGVMHRAQDRSFPSYSCRRGLDDKAQAVGFSAVCLMLISSSLHRPTSFSGPVCFLLWVWNAWLLLFVCICPLPPCFAVWLQMPFAREVLWFQGWGFPYLLKGDFSEESSRALQHSCGWGPLLPCHQVWSSNSGSWELVSATSILTLAN